jgi:hypothetical protein
MTCMPVGVEALPVESLQCRLTPDDQRHRLMELQKEMEAVGPFDGAEVQCR